MITHVDLNAGSTGELHHCSILNEIDDRGSKIWTPLQDGTDITLPLSKADWSNKKAEALILV